MVITQQKKYTAEELLNLPKEGFRYELIQGELKKMSPAGHHHGRITVNLTLSLGQYVKKNDLGAVYAAETGFKIASNPDTVRAPDVSFIKKEQVQKIGDTKGFWIGAPDLAVEVLSPNDKYADVEEKVKDWLNAGTSLVILVEPLKKTVTIYRAGFEVQFLANEDRIEGQDVVPGWKMKLSELFE